MCILVFSTQRECFIQMICKRDDITGKYLLLELVSSLPSYPSTSVPSRWLGRLPCRSFCLSFVVLLTPCDVFFFGFKVIWWSVPAIICAMPSKCSLLLLLLNADFLSKSCCERLLFLRLDFVEYFVEQQMPLLMDDLLSILPRWMSKWIYKQSH